MDFYDGKHVIVTGGAGFIGFQLVTRLLQLGAKVTVLDDFSRGSNEVKGAEYFRSDVTNYESCRFWFEGREGGHEPAFAVFNLAAVVAGVMHNMNHHLPMYYENVKLQTVPLMAADAVGVPNFLQTSSVCVYAPEYNAPSLEENGLLGIPHEANAGYAEAKRDGERLALWSNLEKVIIVRPSNVFGPRDYFDDKAHVIPALIKRVLGEEIIRLYGNPNASREFIYSADVAEGMLVAMAYGKHKQAYNIGTHGRNVISMMDLVKLIMDITDQKDKVIWSDPSEGGGDLRRFSNAAKLMKLGWEAKVGLEEGLRETVEWYANG